MSCRNRDGNTFLGAKCSLDENMAMDARNSAMQYLKIINTNLDFNSNGRALKMLSFCKQIVTNISSKLMCPVNLQSIDMSVIAIKK